ncbi:hypothetical protein LSH36_53g07082 [Paralvinella palmiformis]|uniref:Uncharacterized protein n=1 Tax=Paralvinella palmiformis TaxID=53620 RepID=A0AAD9NEF4_9ANNE|nr:hypothetical protein LSH36_53g07082 [Paralvinella palmiformis]
MTNACDAWLGLLSEPALYPFCQQAISRCHQVRAPDSLHVAPKVQRGEADNGATVICEH